MAPLQSTQLSHTSMSRRPAPQPVERVVVESALNVAPDPQAEVGQLPPPTHPALFTWMVSEAPLKQSEQSCVHDTRLEPQLVTSVPQFALARQL